ncbi:germination protein YpeB [Marinicrinis sediminis]|uniref:Germination protein YpeB n=1 Tax=Marinicrinis sediminis TaxID=1652465 RepID=A0ABW5RD28_9BACL
MYKRLSSILFPIVTIVLIGALYWGYQENQEKNSILIKAENTYQRSFHNLSYHLDQLHNELGNTLAVNSTSQNFHRKCLVNVWRITSEAQSEINQLPLTLMPFHKTEKFLANIASFSYQTAIRDMTQEPMTPEEMKTLKALYKHSEQIASEIRGVQDKVIDNHLRWMDVEVAMASEDSVRDNAIIDGFKLVDEQVSEYEDVDFGPSSTDLYNQHTVKQLSGKHASREDVVKKARQFFRLNDNDVQVVENGKGTEYQSYSLTTEKNGSLIQMDYTTKGAYLIYFMNNREIGDARLNMEQAKAKATEFLEQHDYKQMEPVNFDQYENVSTITFVSKKNNVLMMPEKLSVRVALDNGEVTGLNASEFVYERKDRTWEPPDLTREQAEKKLNEQFKVLDATLVLIEDELKTDRLCYQFFGKINGSTYRIYIDSHTGEEVSIENVKMTEA